MLEDVTVYLLVAPLAATVLAAAGTAAWLIRGRMSGSGLRVRSRFNRR